MRTTPSSGSGAAAVGTPTAWAALFGILLLGSSAGRATATAVAVAGQQQPRSDVSAVRLEASAACVDFITTSYPPGPSSWTFDDCVEVWERFHLSVPPGIRRRLPDVDLWGDTGAKLRGAGAPCLVAAHPTSDGVGSSSIRLFASWIYSEQMGCDWVTPDWGKRRVDVGGGPEGSSSNGTAVMYCHRTATNQEIDFSKPPEELNKLRRCSVMDWLSYFQFDVPSIEMPQGLQFEIVEPNHPNVRSSDGISSVLEGLQSAGFGESRVLFTFHPSYASQFLVNPGSWDERKRQIVRRVLEQARTNFHRHPRPWYDENPKCSFDKDRLHFAVHVRMGDRREFQDGNAEYFRMLELIMATISAEVVGRGLSAPLFHVFSETVLPCPSGEAGLFEEFPTWPVGVDKIPECLAAPTPEDCPEKRAGAFCSPTRDGMFRVVGKDIVLHVGPDVQNALSCMIQADGVLMGCSTFGQVAGLLTRGISMFSMECGGESTPEQYKTIPPLAVAERGHLWVPVAGSWRDPSLTSTALFRGALDTLLSERAEQ